MSQGHPSCPTGDAGHPLSGRASKCGLCVWPGLTPITAAGVGDGAAQERQLAGGCVPFCDLVLGVGRGQSRLTPALESTLGRLFPAPHSMTSCWEHASGLGEGTAQKCTHGKSGLDFSLQSPLLNIHQRCAAWKPQSVPSTGSHRSPPLLQGSRAGSTDPASH